jgi:hypothetical protein
VVKYLKTLFFVFLLFSFENTAGYKAVKVPVPYNITCEQAVENLVDKPESEFGQYVKGRLLGAYYCKDINGNWYR